MFEQASCHWSQMKSAPRFILRQERPTCQIFILSNIYLEATPTYQIQVQVNQNKKKSQVDRSFCKSSISRVQALLSSQPCSVQVLRVKPKCRNMYIWLNILHFESIIDHWKGLFHLFLGGKGKSACNGDSGGPLVCQGEDSKWYQVDPASNEIAWIRPKVLEATLTGWYSEFWTIALWYPDPKCVHKSRRLQVTHIFNHTIPKSSQKLNRC